MDDYVDLSDRFARRLSVAMGRCGIRGATELADFAGIGRTSAYHYLLEPRLPSVRNLMRMADAFGVSCDWLLGIEDEEA